MVVRGMWGMYCVCEQKGVLMHLKPPGESMQEGVTPCMLAI